MTKIKETSTNFENKQLLIQCCSEVYAIEMISGQWILSILYGLVGGKRRYGELKKRIPEITERMLTLQLRKLESNGLVKRTVYAEVPPRVEYELTPSALKLTPILKQLKDWGEQHKEVME
jgi:DNA-binding HxlR family transcriptional regulator